MGQTTTVTAQASTTTSTTSVTGTAVEEDLTTGGFLLGESSLGESVTTQKGSVSPTVGEGDAGNTGIGGVTPLGSTTAVSPALAGGSGGTVTTMSPTPFGGVGTTSTATSANLQTLTPATVLAATADTVAVGGETLSVTASPSVSPGSSEATSDTARTSSFGSPVRSPVSSETLSESTLASLGGGVAEGGVLSESVDGLVQSLRADPFIGEAITASVADVLGQRATVTASNGVVDTRTTTFVTPQSTTGDSSLAPSVAGSTATVESTASAGSPALAPSLSESIGGVIARAEAGGGVGTAFTETVTAANLQTLVPATILGATADTFAVAGETLTLDTTTKGTTVLTQTTSDAVETGVDITPPIAPVLSESRSASALAPMGGVVTGGDGLAESVGGLLQSFQADPRIPEPIATSVSDALVQPSAYEPATVDGLAETTAVPEGPDSVLGSGGLGTFDLGAPSTTQKASATGTFSDSIAGATSASEPALLPTSPVLSDSFSASIGGTVTPTTVNPFLADSLSASSGGLVQRVPGSPVVSPAFTETDSDGDLSTLVPGTVLAATADTFAVAGETLTLNLATAGGDVLTESTSESARVASTVSPILSDVDARTTADAIESLLAATVELGVVETAATSESVSTPLTERPFTADAFTETVADVPALTDIRTTTLLGERFLPDWAILPGPKLIETTKQETRLFDEMTLEFVADIDLLKNNIRPQIQNSGKLEIVPSTDGGFDTVDLAAGTNRIGLVPPTDHELVRPVDDWLIRAFTESPQGTSADFFDVELVVVPEEEKAFDNRYGTLEERIQETRTQDEFLFEFFFGDIATRRVTSDVEKTREGAIDTAELTLILTDEEVRVLEESVSKLYAVKEIDVQDGDGSIRDTNTEQRNTVDITVPDAAADTLENGEYIVTEWETVWTRGLSQEVTLTLKR